MADTSAPLFPEIKNRSNGDGARLSGGRPRLKGHLLGLQESPEKGLPNPSQASAYLAGLHMPWAREAGTLLVASAGDGQEHRRDLHAHYGEDAWVVSVEKTELLGRIETRFRARLARDASLALDRSEPGLSARRVVTSTQVLFFASFSLVIAAGFALAWKVMCLVLVATLAASFLANVIFRATLIWIGAGESEAEPLLPTTDLPPYTVIVPMYREANMVAQIAEALGALDYPKKLLDIKLVLEADDAETLAAALALGLADPFEIITVPCGALRTKPRACNYALHFARGEFTVIYDAEDRPEPDQLKKAVAQFRTGMSNVACLQARLNFYNARKNWLAAGVMAQTPQAI